MKFFAVADLGPTRSVTPEGYLICQDVVIARCGTQDFALNGAGASFTAGAALDCWITWSE